VEKKINHRWRWRGTKTFKNFSHFVLRHGHAAPLLPAKVFGASFRPRPQKKVRSTPLLPNGMPKDAKHVR
jgi:hypothetical protein